MFYFLLFHLHSDTSAYFGCLQYIYAFLYFLLFHLRGDSSDKFGWLWFANALCFLLFQLRGDGSDDVAIEEGLSGLLQSLMAPTVEVLDDKLGQLSEVTAQALGLPEQADATLYQHNSRYKHTTYDNSQGFSWYLKLCQFTIIQKRPYNNC